MPCLSWCCPQDVRSLLIRLAPQTRISWRRSRETSALTGPSIIPSFPARYHHRTHPSRDSRTEKSRLLGRGEGGGYNSHMLSLLLSDQSTPRSQPSWILKSGPLNLKRGDPPAQGKGACFTRKGQQNYLNVCTVLSYIYRWLLLWGEPLL